MNVTVRVDAALKTLPHLPGVPVQVNLRYDTRDPYAVALVILHGGRIVTWLCARSLLRDGLTVVTGEGDVRITPGPTTVGVHLSSPDGTAVLVLTRAAVTEFLRTTYLAVPGGAECAHMDVDWHELLGETA